MAQKSLGSKVGLLAIGMAIALPIVANYTSQSNTRESAATTSNADINHFSESEATLLQYMTDIADFRSPLSIYTDAELIAFGHKACELAINRDLDSDLLELVFPQEVLLDDEKRNAASWLLVGSSVYLCKTYPTPLGDNNNSVEYWNLRLEHFLYEYRTLPRLEGYLFTVTGNTRLDLFYDNDKDLVVDAGEIENSLQLPAGFRFQYTMTSLGSIEYGSNYLIAPNVSKISVIEDANPGSTLYSGNKG